ncbi:hypothetical protein DYB37_006868 [Aphanomyces astaci]|uniref:Mitochondrial import inner membrane translocase subunit TIM23 n=1 Tax=Aphanomyces astaci TaxID=112090 RepID=A0A3R6XFV3_APHAT|nr:hypothetical protein DYB26_011008 [Aphanomyces astaci]RHY96284.1 hypothetical protein DYB35_006334 [Aphanomyces astaci]RHZ19133.1 hypothetical protein DYB37_006868 [Aphanomyces astaci]
MYDSAVSQSHLFSLFLAHILRERANMSRNNNGTNGWNDTEFKNDESSFEAFAASSGPLTLPDFGGNSQIDLGAIAPVFGIAGTTAPSAADYLEYDARGRGFHERATHIIGMSYFGGILGGGAIGVVEGIRNAPSSKLKVRLNSLFNAAGHRGSRAGNALGILALMYSSIQELADTAELERFVPVDKAVPVLAAGATGMLYKATAGTRPMVMAGAIGAVVMGAFQFGSSLLRL